MYQLSCDDNALLLAGVGQNWNATLQVHLKIHLFLGTILASQLIHIDEKPHQNDAVEVKGQAVIVSVLCLRIKTLCLQSSAV